MQDYGSFERAYNTREEGTSDTVHPDRRNTSREGSATDDEPSVPLERSPPELEVRGAFYDFWN